MLHATENVIRHKIGLSEPVNDIETLAFGNY